MVWVLFILLSTNQLIVKPMDIDQMQTKEYCESLGGALQDVGEVKYYFCVKMDHIDSVILREKMK